MSQSASPWEGWRKCHLVNENKKIPSFYISFFFNLSKLISLAHCPLTKAGQWLWEPRLSKSCILISFGCQFETPDSIQRLGASGGRVTRIEESPDTSCEGDKTEHSQHPAVTVDWCLTRADVDRETENMSRERISHVIIRHYQIKMWQISQN